jgi:hypothetical protein
MVVSEIKCVEEGTGTIWCPKEAFNISNVGIHCSFTRDFFFVLLLLILISPIL